MSQANLSQTSQLLLNSLLHFPEGNLVLHNLTAKRVNPPNPENKLFAFTTTAHGNTNHLSLKRAALEDIHLPACFIAGHLSYASPYDINQDGHRTMITRAIATLPEDEWIDSSDLILNSVLQSPNENWRTLNGELEQLLLTRSGVAITTNHIASTIIHKGVRELLYLNDYHHETFTLYLTVTSNQNGGWESFQFRNEQGKTWYVPVSVIQTYTDLIDEHDHITNGHLSIPAQRYEDLHTSEDIKAINRMLTEYINKVISQQVPQERLPQQITLMGKQVIKELAHCSEHPVSLTFTLSKSRLLGSKKPMSKVE